MDYLVFTEVHYPKVSLNRLQARYYNPAKIIAQTCGKLQLREYSILSVKSLQRVIVRDERRIPNFSFP